MGVAPAFNGLKFRNDVLSQLPAEEIGRIRSHLTRVRLVNGQVLHEAWVPVDQVYFVEQGFVSMVAQADEQAMGVEVGVIGRESMVGLSLLLGPEATSYNVAMVQSPGVAFRLPATILLEALDRMPVLTRLLRQGFETFIAQIAQTAACNGRHILPARLAKWLLMAHDRTEGDELMLTQEFLAVMLAVRRSGVTVAVQALATKGLVRHSRGRILISDRPGLEAAACTCYERVRRFSTIVGRRVAGEPSEGDQ